MEKQVPILKTTNAIGKEITQVTLHSGVDYVLGGDDSGSMHWDDKLFAYMSDTFVRFYNSANKVDPDGADILLFGSGIKDLGKVSAEKLPQMLAAQTGSGSTATHLLIGTAWKTHEQRRQMKEKQGIKQKTLLQVFTDGAPDSPDLLKQAIINIANALEARKADADEFLILFVPVFKGRISSSLEKAFNELDTLNEKKGGFLGFGASQATKRDIVHIEWAMDKVEYKV